LLTWSPIIVAVRSPARPTIVIKVPAGATVIIPITPTRPVVHSAHAHAAVHSAHAHAAVHSAHAHAAVHSTTHSRAAHHAAAHELGMQRQRRQPHHQGQQPRASNGSRVAHFFKI